MAGQAERVLDYHRAAIATLSLSSLSSQSQLAASRIVLSTIVEPQTALYKDFVRTLHKEASSSPLVFPVASSSSSFPKYQVWCSNVYLEWRADNPWKTKSKRGLIHAHMPLSSSSSSSSIKNRNEQSHGRISALLSSTAKKHTTTQYPKQHNQQCDLESGLTIGYAPQSRKIIDYTAAHGLDVKDASTILRPKQRQRQDHLGSSWMQWCWNVLVDFVLPHWLLPSSVQRAQEQRRQEQLPVGHLPLCSHDKHPYNCLRYIDSGIYEYSVLKTVTILQQDDLPNIRVQLDSNGAMGTTTSRNSIGTTTTTTTSSSSSAAAPVLVDNGWRKLQDQTFAVLESRFGVEPNFLSNFLKPLLRGKTGHALLHEQVLRQQRHCADGRTTTLTMSEQQQQQQQPLMTLQQHDTNPNVNNNNNNNNNIIRDSSLSSWWLSTSPPPQCNRVNLVVAQELLQQMDQKEQEAGFLKSLKAGRDIMLSTASTTTTTAATISSSSSTTTTTATSTTLADFSTTKPSVSSSSWQQQQQHKQQQQQYKQQQQQQQVSQSNPISTTTTVTANNNNNNNKWHNKYNLVHVVHSRFMQHQAQLLNLGRYVRRKIWWKD